MQLYTPFQEHTRRFAWFFPQVEWNRPPGIRLAQEPVYVSQAVGETQTHNAYHPPERPSDAGRCREIQIRPQYVMLEVTNFSNPIVGHQDIALKDVVKA
jgi:hypothetical protein